jgi:hypothetical protein
MGHVEEVIRMNGVLCRGLAAHHALVFITFSAGHFQERMQAVKLLLPVTLWLYRRSSQEPAFFGI